MQPDLFAPTQAAAPAARPAAPARREAAPFSRRIDRAIAYAAWVEADRPWPPPAGLLSACLAQVLPSGRR